MRTLIRFVLRNGVQFRAGRWILSIVLVGFGALALALVPSANATSGPTYLAAGLVTLALGLFILVFTVRIELAQRNAIRTGKAQGERRVAELQAAGAILPLPAEPPMPKAMTPEDAARVDGYIKQMTSVPWGDDPAIPPEQVRALFDETVGRVRRVAGDWSQFREPIVSFAAMPKSMSYVGAAEIMFRLSFMRGQMWAPAGLRQGLRFVTRAQYHATEALPPDALVIRTKLLAGYPSKQWLDLADQSLAMLQRVAPDHPRIPNAAYLIHLQRKEYEAALACVDQTLAHPPTPDEAYIALTNKATVLQHLQRTDEALAVYDAIIAADPANAWNWHNKSLLLSDLGRDREALDCNTRALSLMEFGAAQRTRERLLAKIGS